MVVVLGFRQLIAEYLLSCEELEGLLQKLHAAENKYKAHTEELDLAASRMIDVMPGTTATPFSGRGEDKTSQDRLQDLLSGTTAVLNSARSDRGFSTRSTDKASPGPPSKSALRSARTGLPLSARSSSRRDAPRFGNLISSESEHSYTGGPRGYGFSEGLAHANKVSLKQSAAALADSYDMDTVKELEEQVGKVDRKTVVRDYMNGRGTKLVLATQTEAGRQFADAKPSWKVAAWNAPHTARGGGASDHDGGGVV